jgi:hypothetical protein
MDTYSREFSVEGHLMHVRISGSFPKERLKGRRNLFESLIEACQRNDCRAAIVDSRDLTTDFDTMDVFRAGVDAAALNQMDLYMAFVAREDMINPFFVDVMINRGARTRVFTDLESARSWISERSGV